MASITVPIPQDRETILQRAKDYMQANYSPEFEFSDGSPLTFIAEAFVDLVATVGENATDATTDIFRYEGANLDGIPPIDAVAATSTVTITIDVTTGYTIPAGLQIAVADAAGNLYDFETTTDAVFAAAATTAAGVAIVASDDGDAIGVLGNDLPGPVQLAESEVHVTAITLDTATSGGSDAEDDDDYLPRLIEEKQTAAKAPILARDFAVLSKAASTEVDRTAALDGYRPADGTTGHALELTLTPVQADGSDVSPGTETAIAAQFAEDGDTPAIVNFIVHIAKPNRTAVASHFTATARPGYDPADVKAAGEDAIRTFLSPADWGQPLTGETRAFEVKSKVTLGELYNVLYSVEGIATVTALTVGLQGGALSAADYTLPVTNAKPVPMPSAGADIVGTVT
jgi:hypothetical protein